MRLCVLICMLLLENCTNKQYISIQNISRETNFTCNMDANIAQRSADLGSRTSNGKTSSLDFKKPFSRFVRALSPSSQTLQTERRPLQFINKRTQAELPFARKASLARFLEKRKERVHIQEEALGSGGDANAANKTTKIYLPFARKASLARFFKKRKERLIIQAGLEYKSISSIISLW
ncbi:hypothetical protein KP509_38G056300 [Ceratopteris richardii]|uniref:Uncharacterized protein n=1 Tax=Ceratopteris richardii TaxID=49495 RepID=A0A8T2Q4F3_CERRI|nr:hypothetical protein KP509_38G056300 [Ceratopteris richardii]